MKYRLVTRSDFDGLVCAVLLRHLDLIDEITFVHPKDVQDGEVEVTGRDILTNLPYAPGAHLVFDHHHSRDAAQRGGAANHIIDAGRAVGGAGRSTTTSAAPSAFPNVSARADARGGPGRLGRSTTLDDILQPAGLDAAELPDGQPHRAGPVPRVPDLQLPADDAADRRVHRPPGRSRRSWRCRTSRSGSSCTASSSELFVEQLRRVSTRRAATWSWWTCATRRRSTPATGSWCTRCSPRRASRCTSSGAGRS